VAAQCDRRQVEHQVRDDDAEAAAGDLRGDEQSGGPAAEGAERPLGEGHDGVERGGDRPKREDQRDERGAGDDGVLQQLQPTVVRGQGLRGDAAADDGGGQQGAADQLGERLTGQARRQAGLLSAARRAVWGHEQRQVLGSPALVSPQQDTLADGWQQAAAVPVSQHAAATGVPASPAAAPTRVTGATGTPELVSWTSLVPASSTGTHWPSTVRQLLPPVRLVSPGASARTV